MSGYSQICSQPGVADTAETNRPIAGGR